MKNLFFALLIVLVLPIGSMAQEAVCAWDKIPVLIAPDKTSAQVGYVRFGTDPVKTTYETITVQEDYKRTYVKIILADGTQGWINQYLLVNNGEAAVVKYDMNLFQNPVDGVTKVKGGELKSGEPVIKTEFNGPYVHIVTKNKEKSGWVPAESLVFGKEEVVNALLLQKANAEKDPKKRVKRIQEIRSQNGFSSLQIASVVDNSYLEATASTYRGPSEEDPSQSVAVRGDGGGGIASTSGSTKLTERIAKPGLNTNQQYVQVGNQTYLKNTSFLPIVEATLENVKMPEFGCLHKTLPIGTKINMYFPDNTGFVELEVIENLREYEGLGLSPSLIKRFFNGIAPETVAIQYFTQVETNQ